jgi:hypothetical protein
VQIRQKKPMSRIRRYSELRRLRHFEERFEYLKLTGIVGASTFGFDRWMNQAFYRSKEWKDARSSVIARDYGCDLGVRGFEIFADVLVHHMNPMSTEDIEHGAGWILDPEYLITTSHRTHNAIHYGDASLLSRGPITRKPGDTKLW